MPHRAGGEELVDNAMTSAFGNDYNMLHKKNDEPLIAVDRIKESFMKANGIDAIDID